MLLLLKTAAGGAVSANLGINFGLSSVSGPQASLGLLISLQSPTSVELQVTNTQDIHFGLTSISAGFLTRSATVDAHLDLGSTSGYAETSNLGITFGLSGTVGSTLQGIASPGISFGLTGSLQSIHSAALTTNLGIAGAATISGGTVNVAASIGLQLNLATAPVMTSVASADMDLDLHGIGLALTPTTSQVATMRLTFEADQIRTFFRRG
jgi:hypothetical protein